MACFGVEYETTAGHAFIDGGTVGSGADITMGPGITEYYTLAGGKMEGVTTESRAQIKPRIAFSLLKPYTQRQRKHHHGRHLLLN